MISLFSGFWGDYLKIFQKFSKNLKKTIQQLPFSFALYIDEILKTGNRDIKVNFIKNIFAYN
jgi:hypothetical protein